MMDLLDLRILTITVGLVAILSLLVLMVYLARQTRRRAAAMSRPVTVCARAEVAMPVQRYQTGGPATLDSCNLSEPIALVLSAEDVIDIIVEFAVAWLRITLGDNHPITAAAVKSAAPALKAYLKSKLPWLSDKIDQLWDIILQKVIETILRMNA